MGPSQRSLLGRSAGAICALGAAATVLVSGARLETVQERPEGAELLYLPSGKYLAAASFGYRHLLADFIYLWAIQYYGHYEIENRYRYLQKIFRDVITELDPNYIDPYWIGALVMSVEARDTDMALGLLDKGIAANPRDWLLPYLAGWECYQARRYDRAAAYFEKAIAAPGAPAVIRRSYAAMFQKQGDLPTALRAWRSIAKDPSMDPAGREIARRHVHDLQIEVDLDALGGLLRRYISEHGAPPPSLETLVGIGWLEKLPVDPEGNPYRYDRRSGRVRAQTSFVLGRG